MNNTINSTVNNSANFTDFLKTYSDVSSHHIIEQTATTITDCWKSISIVDLMAQVPQVEHAHEALKNATLSVQSLKAGKINQAAFFAMSSYMSTFEVIHRMLIPQDLLEIEYLLTM